MEIGAVVGFVEAEGEFEAADSVGAGRRNGDLNGFASAAAESSFRRLASGVDMAVACREKLTTDNGIEEAEHPYSEVPAWQAGVKTWRSKESCFKVCCIMTPLSPRDARLHSKIDESEHFMVLSITQCRFVGNRQYSTLKRAMILNLMEFA